MFWRSSYRTPDGFDDLQMSSDGEALTGLWFQNSRDSAKHAARSLAGIEKDLPIFRETRRWLDIYFSGQAPGFTPPCWLVDATDFRREVSRQISAVPFGGMTTYNDIAKTIAQKRGIPQMSARAVGGAVGWNPICIIIPCHRVVGQSHALTGYGGGIYNKIALLQLEGHDLTLWKVPSLPHPNGGQPLK